MAKQYRWPHPSEFDQLPYTEQFTELLEWDPTIGEKGAYTDKQVTNADGVPAWQAPVQGRMGTKAQLGTYQACFYSWKRPVVEIDPEKIAEAIVPHVLDTQSSADSLLSKLGGGSNG